MNDDTMGNWKTMGGIGDEEARSVREAWTISDAATEGGDGRIVLAGRYRVVKRLGEGGMGSIWLAEDMKLDGKLFAIKMLPAVLAGKKGGYKQVKAEALMAMKLAHPNIATVRAFEEDEGGNPFLVIDYIDGEPLDDILAERGLLSEEETLRILGPVAAALDYAHSKGVVHRDVKPGNVIVAKDGTPYVLDFGIAREVQETLTRVTGKLSSGTLLYMSPEQLNGARPQATQDVYSFAAMAYECLAGEPPLCRGAIEDQIKNKTPEALPEDVGEALRAGIMAGLAKGPEGRPGSCAAVLGSKVEGQRLKVWEDGGKGNNENRFADSEKVGGARKEEREDEDVFLQKVRLRREYDEAVRKAATPEDREALGKIRELFVAGGEALRVGDKKVAGRLFGQMEDELAGWKVKIAGHREREQLEAEARQQREREAREAAERKRRAEEAERLRIQALAESTASRQSPAEKPRWGLGWDQLAFLGMGIGIMLYKYWPFPMEEAGAVGQYFLWRFVTTWVVFGGGWLGLRWVCWRREHGAPLGLVLVLGIVQLFLLAVIISILWLLFFEEAPLQSVGVKDVLLGLLWQGVNVLSFQLCCLGEWWVRRKIGEGTVRRWALGLLAGGVVGMWIF